MNVKEESEKVDLKLNIQKTKIMASGPIPKFNETDFIFENSIGEGSFGTIFEVEEIKTGNKYAIKKKQQPTFSKFRHSILTLQTWVLSILS